MAMTPYTVNRIDRDDSPPLYALTGPGTACKPCGEHARERLADLAAMLNEAWRVGYEAGRTEREAE
jgi:bacterioferritin-associated ferredoxin